MVDAAPFRALRYDPEVAGDPVGTSAPAYDEVERFAYAEHRAASPYTALELLGPAGAADFRRARDAVDRWRRTGVLVPDRSPALYRYEERGPVDGLPTVQRGVLAAVRLDDGLVPHEDVDRSRVSERLRRLEAVGVEVAPVSALVAAPPSALVEALTQPPATPPLVELVDEDLVEHRVWALRDPQVQSDVVGLLASSPAVIADGHHRHARALAYREARRRAHPRAGSGASWERVLTYLMLPSDHVLGGSTGEGPRAKPIHRLLRPVDATLRQRLSRLFVAEETGSSARALAHAVAARDSYCLGLQTGTGAWLLHPRELADLESRLPAERSPLWRSLDVVITDHAVLPQAGITPERVHPQADLDTAADELAHTRDAALLVLRPPRVADVIEVALGGERLPRKATSFVPKPRAGLVMRELAPPPPAARVEL